MAQKNAATQSIGSRASDARSYPRDRFDDAPRNGRTGAHRVTAQPKFNLPFVIGGVVGAALLTTVGVLGINMANSSGSLPPVDQLGGLSSGQKPPALDPEASIIILDGTSPTGELALRLDPIIAEEGWGIVTSAGPATSTEVEISAVFYANPEDAAAARSLALKIGGLSAYRTDEYADSGARLVVLLGSDYAGPGKEPA